MRQAAGGHQMKNLKIISPLNVSICFDVSLDLSFTFQRSRSIRLSHKNLVTPPDGRKHGTAARLSSRMSNDAHQAEKKTYAWWGRKAGQQRECDISATLDQRGFLQFPSMQEDRNVVRMQTWEGVIIFYRNGFLFTWSMCKTYSKRELQKTRVVYTLWIPHSPQSDTNPPSAFGQVREKWRLQEIFCVTEWAPTTLTFWMTADTSACYPLSQTHAYKQTLCMNTCMLCLTQKITAGRKHLI